MNADDDAAPGALLRQVRDVLASDAQEQVSPGARVGSALRKVGGVRGDLQLLHTARLLERELVGAGRLEPLLADPLVTDVLVNAPDSVWVDRGAGLEATDVRFSGEDEVRRLAVRLAAQAGRRLDLASPFVDARLPDGTRFHAIVPPVAPEGTCLSLRVFRQRGFSLAELVEAGTVDAQLARVLAAIVRARRSFVVTGGTGSGKTTLLGALLSLVAPAERLVVVEDAGELRIRHPHVLRLTTRPPNVEGSGAVDLQTLVRQALRMRPDRLVIGEVRGVEVVDLFAAMNTGHDGSCTTLHANSPRELPARFEALAVRAGLDRPSVHGQLGAAVDVVIHVVRAPEGRRVDEIGVCTRDDTTGLVRVVPAVARAGTQWRECAAYPVLRALGRFDDRLVP